MTRTDACSPVTIRPATPGEFAAVGDLCVAAYEPFLDGTGDYIEFLRDAAAERRPPSCWWRPTSSCSGRSRSCPTAVR